MKLAEIIKDSKKIAIAGHVKPDGDCVGSALGIYNYLIDNYNDLEVHIYLEPSSPKLAYLANYDKIENEIHDTEFDLFITVDLADLNRIGVVEEVFSNVKNTFNIDHHISNTKYAANNYVIPEVSSCCEVIYDILDEDKISKNTAEALYTGIVHDSGVFKYASTSEHTMVVAGKLLGKGLDSQKIIDRGFYEKSYVQNQVMGRALMESMIVLDGSCIFSYLTERDLAFYGVTTKELGGIVEQLRLTEGVECAIFMYETAHMEFKVSLRSKEYVNVNEVAAYFGGGGHKHAAGCNFKGTAHDAVNNILKRIEIQIKAHGKENV